MADPARTPPAPRRRDADRTHVRGGGGVVGSAPSSRPPRAPASRPARRARRLPLLLAAAPSVRALSPQPHTLWSATLTLHTANGILGCWNSDSDPMSYCSRSGVFDDQKAATEVDNVFTVDGVDYEVTYVFFDVAAGTQASMSWSLDKAPPEVLKQYALRLQPVGSGTAVFFSLSGQTTRAKSLGVSTDSDFASLQVGSQVEMSLVKRPVWEATLTAKDVGAGAGGCDNTNATAANKCTTVATLSDDDFTLGSATHSVAQLWVRSGALNLVLGAALPDALGDFTLVAGSKKLAFADAAISGNTATWTDTGLTWAANTAVNLSIRLAVPPGAPTHPGASSRDGGLNAFWVAPSDSGDSAITGYDVQYKESSAPDTDVTTVWSATLNVTSATASFWGCDADETGSECSTTSILTSDDFTHGGATYTFTAILDSQLGSGFYLKFDRDVRTALDDLTILVDGTPLAFADATHPTGNDWAEWGGYEAGWSSGDTVQLKLTAPNTNPADGWVDAGYGGTEPRAAIGAPLWSATLTVKDLTGNAFGCDNDNQGGSANSCSTAATLSEDEFTLGGTTYAIDIVELDTVGLEIGVDNQGTKNVLAGWTLYVGDKQFPIRDATVGAVVAVRQGGAAPACPGRRATR